MKIKKNHLLVAVLLSFLSISGAYAQTTTVVTTTHPTVSSGITPDSTFYFLDKFTEQLELLLTFNKTEKAKLQVAFAKERIAEIKTMIATGITDKHYVDSAKTDAKNSLASVNAILDEEKKSGVDTEELEKGLHEDYDSTKKDFEEYVESESKNIEREHERLSKELDSKALSEEQKREIKAQIKALEEKKSRLDEVDDDEELNHEEDELDTEVEDNTEEEDSGDDGDEDVSKHELDEDKMQEEEVENRTRN